MFVSNNLFGKLISSLELPITINGSMHPFFIPNFNLLSCELDSFYIYSAISKQNYNTFTFSCKKSEIASFASSIMKTIDELFCVLSSDDWFSLLSNKFYWFLIFH